MKTPSSRDSFLMPPFSVAEVRCTSCFKQKVIRDYAFRNSKEKNLDIIESVKFVIGNKGLDIIHVMPERKIMFYHYTF